MDKLLVAAAAAADAGEVPVAAAIVNVDGQIIALAENRMKRDGNALHHAELLAIQAAMVETGQSRLDEYDLWVTLEPCTMCASAISEVHIKNVYFGAYDEKNGGIEKFRVAFQRDNIFTPTIYGGVMEKECSNLLKKFFKNIDD